MFQVGKPVTGQSFYDRTEMLKKVKQMILNNQDFMIKAPRRYGKTSLVKQALDGSLRPVLYLDLRRAPRLELLAEQIIDFAYAQAGVKGFFSKLKKDAFALLRESKQTVKVNLELFEYSVEFFAKHTDACEMIVEALEIADKISGAIGAEFIIILDEFQDVTKLDCNDNDILEALRGAMQHHEAITYGFLGSIEHLMTEVFENKKSPFYNFCRKLKLTPFNIDELQEDLLKAFSGKKTVFENEGTFRELLNRLGGHPSNTMLVMQNIYYLALELELKVVSDEMLDKAYDNAYYEMTDLIEQYIHEIKTKKHNYDVLYRLARGEKQKLLGTRLNQIYKSLMEMGHIFNISRGKYGIYDGFLIEYINRSDNL